MKKLTQEERQRQQMENQLADLTNEAVFRLEPTYFFSAGEKVRLGNLQDVVIAYSFYGGRIYEIDFTSVDGNYGRPIINEHQRRYASWIDLRPYHKDENHGLIENEDLQIYYRNTHLMDVIHKVFVFGTDMNPEYQRGYVWTPEDNCALIDSIFKNFDIGKMVFVKVDWDAYADHKSYRILDGKQRINAITMYYMNMFSYKGFYFNDLSVREQSAFKDFMISIADVDCPTKEQEYRYFLALNQHGKAMTKEHLLNVENKLKEIIK